MRYWRSPACRVPDSAIARTLSTVADWDEAEAPLVEMCEQADPEQVLEALLAMFRVFLRDEGTRRANRHAPRAIFDDAICQQLLKVPGRYLVGALLGFAALAAWNPHGSRTCSEERDWIHDQLRESMTTLAGGHGQEQLPRFEALLQMADFVEISLLIGEALTASGATVEEVGWFNALGPRGTILCARHPAGNSNLALALSRAGRHRDAVQLASALVGQHPDNPQYVLRRARLLISAGMARDALSELEELAASYNLDADEDASLASLRQEAEHELPESRRRRERNRRKRERKVRAD